MPRNSNTASNDEVGTGVSRAVWLRLLTERTEWVCIDSWLD